jgi:hypothetical protein
MRGLMAIRSYVNEIACPMSGNFMDDMYSATWVRDRGWQPIYN